MYEATSRIENRTPTESFFSNLRSEIEGLRDEEGSRGNIKIALIELENWTSETVSQLIQKKKNKLENAAEEDPVN
jgi:hypothetical protein